MALKNAVQFAIYTPGSDSGLLVKALSSLALPPMEERANREILIDKISSTVTALLGLVGLKNIDPLKFITHADGKDHRRDLEAGQECGSG